MQHAVNLGQIVASDPAPYHLTGNTWSIPDLSAPQSGYAFAQTPDSTPPTFVSSELDPTTRVLTITFSETIDATNVDAAKIHIRESGNYTGGGITLTAVELGTATDASTISFTLTVPRLATITGLTTPELTVEPGAVRDTSDNLIDGTFDVSTATYVYSFSVSDEDIQPTGMAFSNDGAKMFVVGRNNEDINEYTLTTPFDLSTATFANVIFSVRSQASSPTGMAFSNDGIKMFVVGWYDEDINEYTLDTPFDVSTAEFVDSFSVSSQDSEPTGMAFSNDGTKMFVIGTVGDAINEYTLNTPFDVFTADFVDSFSVSSREGFPQGVAFSNDGTKMFVVGWNNEDINEYTLDTPFDVSTTDFVDSFSVSSQDSEPTGMAFSNNGAKMFVVGDEGDDINEYTLSSVYPIMVPDTEPPVITLVGSNPVSITVDDMYRDAGAICKDDVDGFRTPTVVSNTVDTTQVGTYTVTYSCTDEANNSATQVSRTVNVKAPPPTFVSSELDTATRVLTITFSETIDATNVDAAKIHIRESGNYTGGGITLSASELVTTTDASTISFTLTMPHLETVKKLTMPELTIEPGAVRGISGNLIVSTFDVSTATHVYSFSVSDEDTEPTGMAFSNNGYKMFMVGSSNDKINEYTLTTPFDLSTATHVYSFSVSDEDILPTGMAFSNNGTKMFVVGNAGDDISVYNLTAPFDVSTASYNSDIERFTVLAPETSPQGMAFSNNGLKMFVVGWFDEDINEYTLDTPFDVSDVEFIHSFSVSDEDTEPTGMAFSNNGIKMFVVGDVGNEINEYTLDTPFDVSIAKHDHTLSVSDEDTEPTGMAFSNDGAKMFVVGDEGDDINEYTLSSVYPITVTVRDVNVAPVLNTIGDQTVNEFVELTFTATASDDDALTFSLDGTVPPGAAITDDGNFTWTPTESQVGSHDITVQVTDGSLTDSETLTVTVRDVNLTFVSSELDTATRVLTITFSEAIDATNVDAAKIHIRESGNYTGGGITLSASELGTATDASTISFTLTMPRLETVKGLTTPELTIDPGAVRDTSGNLIVGTFDVSTAAFVHLFDVSGQEQFPTGMAFSNDGTKMFVIGTLGDAINEYTLSTPFDVSTATFANVVFSVSGQDETPTGMAFSNDGAKMFVVGDDGNDISEYTLSTLFDVSTAAFVHLFDVSMQEGAPTGMAFSNDGTKMFVVGWDGADINEYTLDTPFDVSTAAFVHLFDVSMQEGAPTGMAFSNDGTKMFVVGWDGADINEYTLDTPFDVSTAAFVDSFFVSMQERAPTGMAFSNDGAKMFVIGTVGDDINEYTLSSVYPITVTVRDVNLTFVSSELDTATRVLTITFQNAIDATVDALSIRELQQT